MTWKHKTLITLGIIIALIPALGFPAPWENTFLVIGGILIVIFVLYDAWQIRRERGGPVTGSLLSLLLSREAQEASFRDTGSSPYGYGSHKMTEEESREEKSVDRYGVDDEIVGHRNKIDDEMIGEDAPAPHRIDNEDDARYSM